VQDDTGFNRQRLLSEALQQLRSAIELLDEANAPAHIAAHVDLAAHQIEGVIDTRATDPPTIQIDRNAEPQ
jgi:hypothetical protein